MLQKWIEIIRSWPDVVILLNEEGQFVSCSNGFTNWAGWTIQKAEGKCAHDILCAPARSYAHSRDECPLFHVLNEPDAQAPSDKNANVQQEALIKNEDGSYLPAETHMRKIRLDGRVLFLVRFVDESASQHTRSELQRMSYFVDKNPMPLVEFSSLGFIEFSNPQMTSLMAEIGCDDEGRFLMLPEDMEALIEHIISGKGARDGIEVTVPDGRVWSWLFYHFEVEGEDRVHGIATNITERVRREAIEAELEQTAAKMRAAARTQELAKLTHEFRSPLNSLVGFAGILKTRLEERLDEQEQSFLNLIEQGGLKLVDQITTSLDSARSDLSESMLAVSSFGTKALCDELIAQLSPLAQAKMLTLTSECEDVMFETDRAKLSQILVNFLDNAIKYTQTGSVTLVARNVQDAYEFSVIDTGCGLTDAEQIDVFKDFHRANGVDDIQGSGLGLSVVRALARLLQAQVAVESVSGQGSRFYVRLPLS